ncbi:MAG: fimbrillin family protein [Bacteroidaceae bacterium]|nr:fimbrillin family protein [Bacteroidaceae bacterium]
MKKFMLFAAMASVVLTSCVNEDMEVMESASKKAISFDMPVMKPTRAQLGEIIGTTYPGTESFKVYCKSYTGTYAGWEGATNYFNANGEIVSKSGTQWTTTTPHYWPELGNDLVFAAYSPADAAGTYSQTNAGLQIDDFTTAAANSQYDLMYTARVTGKNKGNNGDAAVSMVFKHALTSVVFSAVAADDKATYNIKSLTVNGDFVTTADFNQNIATAADTDGTPVWTPDPAATTSYGILSGANVAVANSGVMLTGNGSAAEAKSALLLIPQGVNPDATVTINYEKTTTDGTLASTATVKLSDFKAGGAGIDKWVMGNRYVYNIIFGANKPIHFSPSIEADWTTTTLDYTIQ